MQFLTFTRNNPYISLMIIVVCFLSLGNRENDKVIHTWEQNDFYLSDEANLALESIKSGEETIFRGLLMSTSELSLKKGTYSVTLNYSAQENSTYCEVYSSHFLNEDNTLGKTVERVMLPATQTTVSFQFHLPEDFSALQLGIQYGGGNFELYTINLKSNFYCYNDTWLFIISFIILILAIFFTMKHSSTTDKKWIIICLLFTVIISSLPSFIDFIRHGHDLTYHLARIEGIKEALQSGQFPVRINPFFFNGHGYATSTLYPELFLYFPALLMLCNISLITAFNYFCVIINLATALVSYFSFSKLFNSKYIGLFGSILYTLSLYRLINMYWRVAVGEELAMIFLPLLILGFKECVFGNYKKWYIVVIAASGILQSHIISTEICILFVLIFLVFCFAKIWSDKKRLFAIIKAGLFTFFLNSWSLIPFLYYSTQDLNVFHATNYVERESAYFSQIFSSFLPAQGGSLFLGTTLNEMPLSVGFIFLIGIVLFAYCWFFHMNDTNILSKESLYRKTGEICFVFGIVSLLMSSTLFPWKMIRSVPLIGKIMTVMQFPWRYLAYATAFLCVAFLAAFYFIFRKHKEKMRYASIFILILAFGSSAFFLDSCNNIAPVITQKHQPLENYNIYDQYFYRGTDLYALKSREPLIQHENVSITNLEKEGCKMQYSFEGNTEYFELPLYFYPGYQATLDDKQPLTVTKGTNNLLRVLIPENVSSGTIHVRYRESILFIIGDLLTVLTILLIFVTRKIDLFKHPKRVPKLLSKLFTAS